MNNGGVPILSYRVKQRVVDGDWSIIATGLTVTNHIATDLTLGTTYEWTVEALNSVGYSAPSVGFVELHALKPDTPVHPTTTNVGQTVVITWPPAVDNGATITQYIIYIKQQNGVYTEETVACNGAD